MFITSIPQITHIYISTMPDASVVFIFARICMAVNNTSDPISAYEEQCKKHLLSKQALGEDLIWIENYL